MSEIKMHIYNTLRSLIGLRLCIARRAADMRIFHFGSTHSLDYGTLGDYALHIQCPWRLEGANGIITGSSDLWIPDDQDCTKLDSWDYDKDGNLQDKIIGNLFNHYEEISRSYVNNNDVLTVLGMLTDRAGGFKLEFDGKYFLSVFPDGTIDEDWRFFSLKQKGPHLVVVGGAIEVESN